MFICYLSFGCTPLAYLARLHPWRKPAIQPLLPVGVMDVSITLKELHEMDIRAARNASNVRGD
jgi:hypothetical protein